METEPALIVEPSKKPSAGTKIWIFVLVIYVFACMAAVGVGGWLSYIAFQATVEKDNIPYATATALAQWPVIFHDEFGKVSNVWYVGSYTGKDYTESYSIANGEYAWEIKSTQGYTFWQNAGLDGLSDFVLSVDVRHIAGSAYDGYGLEFRNSASNHYLFLIRDSGDYSLYLHSLGKWNEIIPYTRSSLIRAGKFNTLTVQALGPRFQLFINGAYVNEFMDSTLTVGDVGVAFNLYSDSEAPGPQQPQGITYSRSPMVSRVVFDNFEVRAPQSPTASKNQPPQLPQIKPVSGRLVFASDRGGNRNIYTINTDGSGLKQLTDDPAADYAPRWSPDGKKIVFVSSREGNSEIYVMDADGGHPIRLTDNPADDLAPDWSPDGKQIVFASHRNANFDIYLMSALGEKDSLTQLTDTKLDEINPVISPDGADLIYQVKKNVIYRLMLMPMIGKSGSEVQTYYTDSTAADAAWAPDGLRIAYVERWSAVQTIIIMDDAHQGPGEYTELTENMNRSRYPNWSPDGKQLVFVSEMDGQTDMYILLADGSGIFRVTHNEAAEESPDWTAP